MAESSRKRQCTIGNSSNPDATDKAANEAPEEYLRPINLGRISAVIPQGLIAELKKANIIGYRRPAGEQFLNPRYYTLNIGNIRNAITVVMRYALRMKFADQYRALNQTVNAELNTIVYLTVDACMITLYAKLHTIHKAHNAYNTRFETPSSYTNDIEIPLPFAEAISNISVFKMTCSDRCYLVVPVIPEGMKNECRANEDWQSFKYESCIRILKDCGIPCKSVNTSVKTGSAWWTYKIKLINNTFDATMIFAPKHYTDHCMTLALMFIIVKEDSSDILPIVEHKDDDLDYDKYAWMLRRGFEVLTFNALCGMPPEEWSIL